MASDARSLARAVGRGKRSAIRTWTFEDGGLVVEGGRRADRDECGPLIARVPFPPSWRCVVAIPEGTPGISGAGEAEAFARLPAPPERVERVAHVVLMALLPALADADLAGFGRALTEVQEIHWSVVRVGAGRGVRAWRERRSRAASARVGCVRCRPELVGPCGVRHRRGRRRWTPARRSGPCALGSSGTVFEGPFRSDGAHLWRSAVHATRS